MPLLNEADEIYFGSDPTKPAEQIYLGGTQLWVFATVFGERLFEQFGAFVTEQISTS